ncbi:MAG: hypothetical protein VKO64_04205 [Candidatus Sericytochromatia bacterium]|nr:hypothetical protein [Candidatus Sericytochromatia bacterium]
MGAATISGPQGSFPVSIDGKYTLLENRDNVRNFLMEGTFVNKELRSVTMQFGGKGDFQGSDVYHYDKITYTNDNRLIVNGVEVTGDMTTPLGTKISKNGDQVVITTPDGDTMKMYQSFCEPPTINIEGDLSKERDQGSMRGLVGTFDDSIPDGTPPLGTGKFTPGSGSSGDAGWDAFWSSWNARENAKRDADKKEEEAARDAEVKKVADLTDKIGDASLEAAGKASTMAPPEVDPTTGEVKPPTIKAAVVPSTSSGSSPGASGSSGGGAPGGGTAGGGGGVTNVL